METSIGNASEQPAVLSSTMGINGFNRIYSRINEFFFRSRSRIERIREKSTLLISEFHQQSIFLKGAKNAESAINKIMVVMFTYRFKINIDERRCVLS